MTRAELIEELCPAMFVDSCSDEECGFNCGECEKIVAKWIDEHDKQIRADVIEEFRTYLKTVTHCEMPKDLWDIGVDNTCDRMLKEKK